MNTSARSPRTHKPTTALTGSTDMEMKVTIPRKEIKEAVAGFGKIVSGKTTLPVLGCVRFDNDKGVSAQVTDLDQYLRYRFAEARAVGDGAFVVPLAALKDLAKGSDGENVEIEAGDNGGISVTNHVGSHAVKRPLQGLDPEEWPQSPAKTPTKPAEGFLATYRRLVPFSSTDTTRHVLNSVYVEVAETGENPVTMVATDGRRLALWNTMCLPLAMSTIVPTTKFLQWTGLGQEARIGLRTEQEKKETRVLGLAVAV
ncbi:MAG: DNA polymerase III subunit beta, partial [Verrucomicrobia bacterium]|nr:DNA polymerase III subunit beta [Verrucomicrobiota bacterium]